MKKIIIFFIAIFSYALQTTVLQHFHSIGISINASFVFICILALYSNFYFGMGIVLLLGLVHDVLFSPWLGLQALIFVTIYILIYYFMREKITKKRYMILMIFTSTFLIHLMYLLFLFFFGHPLRPAYVLFKMFLGESFGNIIVSIPIYMIFNKIYKERDSNYIHGI
jgi:rod shape-determining protein MreD